MEGSGKVPKGTWRINRRRTSREIYNIKRGVKSAPEFLGFSFFPPLFTFYVRLGINYDMSWHLLQILKVFHGIR